MLDYLTKEDLPISIRDVVDVIGLDSVKELIKFVGGTSFYVPNEKSVTKSIRNKIIKDSFNGDYKELSRKFGISEVQVRNIINPNI